MSDFHSEPAECSQPSLCRFNRRHLMITLLIEGVLAVLGIVMAVLAHFQPSDQAYRWLLTAVCLFLLQNAVVATAILVLLVERTGDR